jgi:hypothetical protein
VKVTKLTKEALLNEGRVRLTVEITIDREELQSIEYSGFDLLPDSMVADVLTAVGRKYSRAIRNGKIDPDLVDKVVG